MRELMRSIERLPNLTKVRVFDNAPPSMEVTVPWHFTVHQFKQAANKSGFKVDPSKPVNKLGAFPARHDAGLDTFLAFHPNPKMPIMSFISSTDRKFMPQHITIAPPGEDLHLSPTTRARLEKFFKLVSKSRAVPRRPLPDEGVEPWDPRAHLAKVVESTHEIAEPLITTCDSILLSHPDSGIIVVGTGSRSVYSVFRKLAHRLPGRGKPTRVKLLDVSTKLLFGKDKHFDYTVHSIRAPSGIFTDRDPDAEKKILSYAMRMKVFDLPHNLIIDTGLRGTVPQNLKEIFEKAVPTHRFDPLIFSSNGTTSVPTPVGLDPKVARRIAIAVESGKSEVPALPAGVKTGHGFEKWDYVWWRPKYRLNSEDERKIAAARQQALNQHVADYITRRKSDNSVAMRQA